MTSVPSTPMREDGTSSQDTPSPLSDISMESIDFHPLPPPEVLVPAATPTTQYLRLQLIGCDRIGASAQAVLFNPELLQRIMSFVYSAPSDYMKGSHLIPFDANDESYSLFQLYDLQLVCQYWRKVITSSWVLPFRNPVLAQGGDDHRLHIPFLTWLGNTMKRLAKTPTIPKTNFSEIAELVRRANPMDECFSATDYISDPPVSKIWLGFQADRHPPFTKRYYKNPDPMKRKAICCSIGDYLQTLEFSFKIRDRRKADRITEDAFIIENETGVTVTDVADHILGIIKGYHRIKSAYMLWMIEVGFLAGTKEVLGEPDIEKRLQKTLFETCNRSARIFLVDSRLEIKNEDRVAFKPSDDDYDPFYDPTAKKKKGESEDESEGLKLSIRRTKQRNYSDDSEDEEDEEDESDDDETDYYENGKGNRMGMDEDESDDAEAGEDDGDEMDED
ncbi:hypothetical protein TWF281_004773 [Arthrobotrys megalospora]